MVRTAISLFFLYIFLTAQSNTTKKELLIYGDDFSQNNWTVLSTLPGDSVNHFALSQFKYRSMPSSMAVMASYPGPQDEWIISPQMDFSASGSSPLLTFYEAHDSWYQGRGTHEILYALTDNPSPEDFQSVVKWKKENHSIYGFYGQPVNVSLDGLEGESVVYLAFRYISDQDQYDDNWYIDDLSVSQNVLFDGTIFYSSLTNDSKLSATAQTPLTVYPQNRGLEKSSFPVIAKLIDYNGKMNWSDTLETREIDYLGKDTLSFTIDTVKDSAWFNLLVYTDLQGDQARNNDTLSFQLNTYQYPRRVVAEAFLSSNNYFSEGPALIVDSLAKLTGSIDILPVCHYYLPSDTLYSSFSNDLAVSYGINTASTIFLNRQVRYYEPFTILQDWATRVSALNTGVISQGNKKTSLGVSGEVIRSNGDGSLSISLNVTQKALLPDKDFSMEVWWIEKKRTFSWVRLDTVYHRAIGMIFDDQFSSAFKGDVIYSASFDYSFPSGDDISDADPDQSYFIAMVRNEYGSILNAGTFNVNPSFTDINNDNYLPGKFRILGNYPNPFNPSSQIKFYLPEAGNLGLEVYNVTGQLIFQKKQYFAEGNNTWIWNGSLFSSGVYFAVIKYKAQTFTHQMMMLK